MLEELFRAVRRGEPEKLAALLATGADPAQTYHGGDSLLSLCMPYNPPEPPGHLAVLDQLLQAGVSPDSPYRDGSRPLLVWASAGHAAAVDRLLAAGADRSGTEASGKSLLLCAAEGGLVAVVRSCLAAGDDVHFRGPEGVTALHLAADAERWRHGHTKASTATIEALVAGGADVEASTVNGTPLHIAAEKGRGADTLALLQGGASPAVRSGLGVQPLHLAALGGVPDSVRHLLAAGADPDAVDTAGWTPLHYAAHGNQPAAATLLLAAGADPTRKSTDRRSIAGNRHGPKKRPADIARRYRRTALVALLEG